MGFGWTLDAVQTVGDMDYICEPGYPTFDGAYASSDVGALPAFYCVGNHEIDNAYDMPALRNKYLAYPNWNLNSGPANCLETTYSYDVGDIHIAVLNEYFDGTSDTGTDGDVVDELFNWLKIDLRNSTKPYKIVVGHEPAYPVGRHEGNSLDKYPTNRDRFWNLLKTERVTAYITSHTHLYKLEEYDGVFEVDCGVSGGHVGQGSWDDFATLVYTHCDSNGFVIRGVNEDTDNWGGIPTVTTKRRSDLKTQVLVNTAHGAGTACRYFIDYTEIAQPNPDWSAYGTWWENAFNDVAAGWSDGELGVGYDSTNPAAWGWINKAIDPDPTSEGDEQVYGVFARIPFTVYDKSAYSLLKLGVDYDDAIAVWLNGVKIYESPTSPTISSDDYWDRTAIGIHSSGGDEDFNPVFNTIDVSSYMSSLNEGSNLLVIGNWNWEPGSSDLIAGAELYLEKAPSCPSLYFWNGNHYVDNGFIIPGAIPRENEYVHHSRLNGELVAKDNRYWLQIRETEPERSFIDDAKLLVVHRSGDTINKRIVLAPVTAEHSQIGDVRLALRFSDDRYVPMIPGDVVTLSFPYYPLWNPEWELVFVAEGYYVPLEGIAKAVGCTNR